MPDIASIISRPGSAGGFAPVRYAPETLDATPLRNKIDAAVLTLREETPPAVANMRRAERLSIREMNSLDSAELIRRITATGTPRDTRPGIVRVLDLIDLPRNVLYNLVFPEIAHKKRLAGEYGAAGTGRVMTSDILKEMGIKSPVVRGLVGFVGDVLFDPLTYLTLGSAGAVRVTGKAGSSLLLRKTATKAMREGAEQFARRGLVADVTDETVRNILRVFTTDGEQATRAIMQIADPAHRSSFINALVSGDRNAIARARAVGIGKEETVRQTLRNKLLKIKTLGKGSALRETSPNAGHLLANAVLRDDELGAAARQFVGQHGVRGMDILAVPFANKPLLTLDIAPPNIPGFRRARTSILANRGLASGSEAVEEIIKANARLEKATKLAEQLNNVENLARKAVGKTQHMKGEKLDEWFRTLDEDLDAAVQIAEEIGEPAAVDVLIDAVENESGKIVGAYLRAKRAAQLKNTLAEPIWKYTQDIDDLAAAEVAKMAMGTTDDLIGINSIAGLSATARDLVRTNAGETLARVIERMGQLERKVFGTRGTYIGKLQAQFNRATNGADVLADHIVNGVMQDFSQAAKTLGPDITEHDVADAVMLRWLQRQGEQAGFIPDGLWKEHLQESLEKGILQTEQGRNTVDRLLEQYAEPLFSDMYGAERRAGLVGSREEALIKVLQDNGVPEEVLAPVREALEEQAQLHIPSALTPRGEQAINQQRKLMGSRQAQALETTPQLPETMFGWKYIDEEGKERIAWGWEILGTSDDEAARRSRAAFFSAAKQGKIANAPMRLSVWDKNAIAVGKHPLFPDVSLNGLVHPNFTNATDSMFFDDNLFRIMQARIATHEKLFARKEFADHMKKMGLYIPEDELVQIRETIRDKGSALLPDGREVKLKTIATGAGEREGFVIGGRLYRPLNTHKLNMDNPILTMIGKKGHMALYEDQVADVIENVARKINTDEDIHAALNAINKITGWWKVPTLFHPSWVIMNVVGGVINAAAEGMPFNAWNRRFIKMGQIVKNIDNPEILKNINVNIGGVERNGLDIAEELIRNGVVDQGFVTSEMMGHYKSGHLKHMVDVALGGEAAKLRAAREAGEQIGREAFRIGREGSGVAAPRSIAGSRRTALKRGVAAFTGAWFRANRMIEDTMRATAFAHFLDESGDVANAAERSLRAFFDYGDLTNIERKGFRTAFPFYTWISRNLGYQFLTLARKPGFINMYPKVQVALEEMLAGEGRIPNTWRPNWMRSQMALQIGRDPRSAHALMFASGTPVQELLETMQALLGVEGAQDMLHYFVSSSNPLAKIPLELATRREIFTGRTIGSKNLGELSVREYMLNQIRPLREVGAIKQVARKGGIPGVAGRLLLGGRLQDMSLERVTRHKLRELKDEERKLRATIARANGRGEHERSLKARAQLMELYMEMESIGLSDEVPKWAREQLEEFRAQQLSGGTPPQQ